MTSDALLLPLRLRLLAFVLPFIVTLPRFWNGFVFDDVFVIERGTFIHDLANLPTAFRSRAMVASTLNDAVGTVALDTYRPLTIATFFWDSALSGRAPWSYHLTSATLHSATTVLVQALLARMLPALSGRQVTALACLFGLSPWLCEAHVFINGRSDLLLGLFAVAAILLQQDTLMHASLSRACLTGVTAMLGLLSKETMVLALPFVWLVPTTSPLTRPMRTRARYAVPSLVALVAYLAMRALALDGLRSHAGPSHIGAALDNLPLLWLDTLTRSWLPGPYVLRNLRDDYAAAPAAYQILSWLVLLGTFLGAAYTLWRRRHLSAWALGLAFATTAPAVLITTELWQGFGRYLYLPAVGVTTLLGEGLGTLDRWGRAARPSLRAAVLSAPYVLCAFAAFFMFDATLGFRDERTLYTRALSARPKQAWPYGSLGMSLRRNGRCNEAVGLLTEASRRAPSEPRYAIQLARCLVELGARSGAREVAQRGRARFRGSRAEAGFLVAEFLTLPRGHPDAAALMERCLVVSPQRPDCVEGLRLARLDRPVPPP